MQIKHIPPEEFNFSEVQHATSNHPFINYNFSNFLHSPHVQFRLGDLSKFSVIIFFSWKKITRVS